MRDTVVSHLGELARGHRELAVALPEDSFREALPARSNTIGAQFWCVVGARESYTRAIVEGAWRGFSCSLAGSEALIKARVVEALQASEESLGNWLRDLEWNRAREGLLLRLLEHEAQHQGQLIRYVYALGYSFPESWRERWALSQ